MDKNNQDNSKQPVIVVYTGNGKGKTSASLGLMLRALGADMSVAFVQFIKHWDVSEHTAIKQLQSVYGPKLSFYKGGMGFYNAGEMSAEGVSADQHKQAAAETLRIAGNLVNSGKIDLVICDEINNAVHDGLIKANEMAELIESAKEQGVSLCLSGRDYPDDMIDSADIVTNMAKLKHHFDQGILATKGIDF